MKLISTTLLLAAAVPALWADVRVNIRLGTGHPIVRPGRTVVVRARPAVVVAPRLVYAPPVVWTRTVIAVPPRQHIAWESSETLLRREEWVDSMLGVNQRGNKLYLRVNGRAQVDFAEVHFANGQVQVVDFHEELMRPGTYTLLDFADGRHVDNVRLVARARTPEARVDILMAR